MIQTIKMDYCFDSEVEILKKASKMAASLALKLYLTNVLNKNHFNFDFYGC